MDDRMPQNIRTVVPPVGKAWVEMEVAEGRIAEEIQESYSKACYSASNLVLCPTDACWVFQVWVVQVPVP